VEIHGGVEKEPTDRGQRGESGGGGKKPHVKQKKVPSLGGGEKLNLKAKGRVKNLQEQAKPSGKRQQDTPGVKGVNPSGVYIKNAHTQKSGNLGGGGGATLIIWEKDGGGGTHTSGQSG